MLNLGQPRKTEQSIPVIWKTKYETFEERRNNATSSSLEESTQSTSLADIINVRGIKIAGWTIETHRGSIADSKTIDELSDSWGIPLPEMPFDKNKLMIRYDGKEGDKKQLWQYSFDGMSALQSVEGVSKSSALKGLELNQSASYHKGTTRFGEKPKQKRVQVSYANEWGKKRDQQQKPRLDTDNISASEPRSNFGPDIAMAAANNSIATARDFDWTYTSTWPGKEHFAQQSLFTTGQDPNRDRIPIERLGPPPNPGAKAEPILFFDDLILFEDELGDNGTSLLNVKVRVMPTGLLVLQRFFLRVDNVVFRVFDTRMYIGFYDDETIISHTPSLQQQGQNISRATEQLTKLSLDSQSKQTPALASPFRVIRECNGMEEPYSVIRSRLPPYKPNDLSPLTDVGWVAQQLTKMEEDRQRKLFTAHQSRTGLHSGTTVSLEQSDPTQPAVLPSDTVPGQESNRILGEIEDDTGNYWEGQGYRIDVALLYQHTNHKPIVH